MGGAWTQQTPEWCRQLSLPVVAAAGAHMRSHQPAHGLPAHHKDCACWVALTHLPRKSLAVIHLQDRRWAVSNMCGATASLWLAEPSLETKSVVCGLQHGTPYVKVCLGGVDLQQRRSYTDPPCGSTECHSMGLQHMGHLLLVKGPGRRSPAPN